MRRRIHRRPSRLAATLLIGLAAGLLPGCADTGPLGLLGLGECQFGGRGGLCTNGPCSIVVPISAVRRITRVEIEPVDPPEGLREETAGGLLCRVGPADLSFERPVELRIDYTGRALPEGLELEDLSGFEVLPSGAAAPLLGARPDPEFSRLVAPIEGAARVGATFVPVDVDLVDVLGRVPFDVSDVPSYLRTISSFVFDAAFYDGQRLYVGNGPRLLIWSDGPPEDPFTPPDVVLGRPDLVTLDAAPSAADFSGTVAAIWSDGVRLAVAEGNRVLIYNRVPTESHAPADLVLGQPDFDGAAPNAGGAPSAATLRTPSALASDGTRLMVADTNNHRTLIWNTFPRLVGQPADLVVGQETSADARIRGGALPLYQPRGVYLDAARSLFTSTFGCACALGVDGRPLADNPAFDFTVGLESSTRVTAFNFSQPSSMSAVQGGGFALRDRVGNRVNLWSGFPSMPDQVPDIVLGKPDFTVGGLGLAPVSASSFAWEQNGAIDAARGLIAVPDQRRVLIWTRPPTHRFAPADLVIGQPSLTTADRGIDYRSLAVDTVAYPTAVSAAAGRRAVADEGNNRVVLYTPEPEGGVSTVVLGQADGLGFAPNRGRTEPNADTLSGPRGVFTDGRRVVVADTQNHRILLWNDWPTRDGARADLVIGQGGFTSSRPNRGQPDVNADGWPDASARALFYPSAVTISQDRLLVSDTFNHRVLVFPLTRGGDAAAMQVIGQADFEGVEPNRGRGWFERGADGLALPMGLTVAPDGVLYVADRENNRILGFAAPWTGPAARVLGQPDLTADETPNFYGPTAPSRGLPTPESSFEASARTLRRPEGVAWFDGRLLVADTENHRLLAFAQPRVSGSAATAVLGQADLERRDANADGVSASSLSGPTSVTVDGARIWVTDRENHRLLGYARGALEPNGDRAAVELWGQLDFIADGINGSAGSPGQLAAPSGVAWDGDRLWVADREQHRVLAYEDGEPVLALGQNTLTRSRENAGRATAADTLSEPTDVFADGSVIVVADRGNHRVLLWRGGAPVTGRPADVVVGQADFQGQEPDRGRGLDGAGPDSLRAPEGVFYDGASLYVADTGNNRVLVFDEPLPPTGARARAVIGQTSPSANLPNAGRDGPAADTLSSPKDITVAEGRVWIADTINNRVLGIPRGDRVADVVLGQPDAVSRGANPAAADTLRSPVGVAYDGQNLLVTDTGNNRVLVFETPPTETGAAASLAIGQPSLVGALASAAEPILARPSRVAVAPRPFNSARVFVADTGKSRVAVYDGLARIDAE